MENLQEIVSILFPAVEKSTFGQKMFNRIAPLVQELDDKNANKNISQIETHLRYQAGCSQEQQIVFTYLADIAKSCMVRRGRRPKNAPAPQNWRHFVKEYANLSNKLGGKKIFDKDFWKPF